jgi:putative hemolysin
MIDRIVLILVALFTVIIAGLFAGAETGMYRLSRLRLRLGVEKKQLLFVLLGKAMHDSPGLLLSTLLGTNLAHYLATSIITYMLLTTLKTEHTAELFATLITAPMFFVFSELIPKNIFFYRADLLMPYTSPVLFILHRLFSWSGIVPLLKFISTIFARITAAPDSSKAAITATRRPHIEAILHETREEGFLSPVQTDIINRLAGISHLGIRSVMTPLNKAQTVDVNSDRPALLNKLRKSAFTRLLTYDRWPANIVGFVNIYEALSSMEQFTDLRGFIKPIRRLPADTIVSDAINIMQSENQRIILVTRATRTGREKHIGIVTMKDLVEELLGELAEW